MVNILDYIPYGYEQRVSRQELCMRCGLSDRKIRDCIALHNINGNEIIISLDGGYFVFDGSKQDRDCLNAYINIEQHRAAEISKKIRKMQSKYRRLLNSKR